MKQYLKLCPLMGLGIGLLAHPAYAGHWDVTYVTSGTYVDDDYNHNPNHTWTDNRTFQKVEIYDNMIMRDMTGQATKRCKAIVKGDFKAVFTWVPSPGDATPSSVSVKESVFVAAGGIYKAYNSDTDFYDNKGAQLIEVSNPIEDKNETELDDSNGIAGKRSSSSRLTTLKVNNDNSAIASKAL